MKRVEWEGGEVWIEMGGSGKWILESGIPFCFLRKFS